MIDWLIVVFAVYLSAQLALSAYRSAALRRASFALRDREFTLGASLAWAWASERDLRALAHQHGESTLGQIFLEQPFHRTRLLNPVTAAIVLSILVYQRIRSSEWRFSTGDCPAVPNCSNYAIGALTRYGLFTGCAKAWLRCRSCPGETGSISYHEQNF